MYINNVGYNEYRFYVYGNGKSVSILEHRLNALLKYPLKEVFNENNIIHHKNGCKLDNDIENLELSTRQEHARTHYNSSGYANVSIVKSKRYTQGFYYQYQYYEDNERKRLRSVDLDKLEQRVKSKGLEWRKID